MIAVIKEAERQLFAEWQQIRQYPYFISDGVFDEIEWQKQPFKVLYVLKEANWENANEDLCAFLLSERSPTYWKTWNNIARWSKAILEGGDYPRYVSRSDKSYWLRKVAAMNLKKVGGDAVAENETIYSYGNQDRVYIKRQIELYAPDLIICCGRGVGKNADILHDKVFEPEEVSEWQEPILQYNYFLVNIKGKENVPVVSFYHPQMRGSHALFEKRYEEMKFVAQELREKYMR
ncbi:MAG: hypothetical protein IKU26_00370 [Clostridia bacterium]|nr:hypothetical protein [Clostridia bacterium]